ncbi:MAG: methyltransferase family protein [Candidatus Acidoferrum typicum]|nr:methyltransferase family protein [Candidatus Acidoferrum typicum]
MVDSRAPKEYWDAQWQDGKLPRAINPRDHSLKNDWVLKFDSFFRQLFAAEKRVGDAPNLIELGCARSAWLPYFSKELGFCVAGIDYSPVGCDQARAILAMEGVEGDVTLADISLAPAHLLNRFDCAVSFGLVEHFEPTCECLRACSAFLKPGGTMVTVIPNLNGIVGGLQKWLGREVYDLHVPLDAKALRRAHEDAGLDVLRCEYFCFMNFGILNLNRIRQFLPGFWFSRVLDGMSAATWMLDRMGVRLPANKMTSPYVICVSTKTVSSGALNRVEFSMAGSQSFH